MLTDPSVLHAALLQRLRDAHDRPFLIDASSGEQVTFGEAAARSLRWASAFDRAGVQRGDIVVAMQHNTITSIEQWLGLGWLGAAQATIHTDYRTDHLVHALQVTSARTAVVLAEFLPRLVEIADKLTHLRTVVVLGEAQPVEGLGFEVVGEEAFLADAPLWRERDVPRPWEIATVVFTSGTTGPSKAVALPWAQLFAHISAMYPLGELGPDDVIYGPGSAPHVGAKAWPFIAVVTGAREVLRPYISLTEYGPDHERYAVTASLLFPGIFEDYLLGCPKLPLRFLIAPQPVPRIEEIKKRLGVRTLALYGMTELSIPICDESWDSTHPAGSCGKLRQGYPSYEVRIVDENDQDVPVGVAGELIVRAAAPWTITPGYVGMPEATVRAWRNGWFHTGDGLRRDEDGYFYFVDRVKDAIRRKLENISSFEVESYVQQHPNVMQCAAVGVKVASHAEEEVRVFVIPLPGEDLDPEELLRFLIPRMPRFMVPRYVDVVTQLPITVTYKVKKAELRSVALGPSTFDREAAGLVVPR